MKKYLLLLLLLDSGNMQAQSGIADNWFFGVLCGMKFATSSTNAIASAMYTNEGCAGISDSTGTPLFYTDGVTVWNSANQIMPNGTGLLGSPSSTQSALIVPMPGSASQYYIFTVAEIGGPDGFRYSIADMTLQGGSGDITSTKNVPIKSDVTEKLTAVKNASGNGYWVMVHELNSDAFYAYELTAAGLSAPVISNAGIVHNNSAIQNTYGQMKFNTCGNMVALAAGYLDVVEVFHFDNATGTVSNTVSLPQSDHVYGVEFSIDGKFLYVSCYNPLGTLLQYDLQAGNAAAILATQTVISSTPDIYGLQIANNEKIYVCKSFSQFMGTIESPTLAGTACNYIDANVFLDPNSTGATSSLSLPGFVTSFLGTEGPCFVTAINENSDDPYISVAPNPSATQFSISIKNNRSELYIYDAAGRMMEQQEGLSAGSTKFGSRLEPGIYNVIVNDKSGLHHQQVVKL
jgi:hypothetical protein